MPIYDLSLSNVTKIDGGYGHSLAVTTGGKSYAWGLNDNYQLGNGNTTNLLTPTQIGSDTDWVDVACGDYHSVAIKSNGTAYAWGRNVENQCGRANTSSGYVTTPTLVVFPQTTTIDKIAASKNYTLFADTGIRRTVYGAGENNFKVLHSSFVGFTTPTAIAEFANATLIAAGPQLCGAVIGSEIRVRGVYDFSYESAVSDMYTPLANPLAATVPNSTSPISYLSLGIGYDFLLAIKQDGTLWG